MSNDDIEDIFKRIDFPNNKWRKVDKGDLVAKKRIFAVIAKLSSAKLPVADIRSIISDLYWDAFVEQQLQCREVTGKTVKEAEQERLATVS